MPPFFALAFELFLMFIVFTRICRLKFHKIKIVLFIAIIPLILFPLVNFISATNISALIFNIAFVAFTTFAAYRKTNTLKLSAFYAIFSNIVYLLAAFVTNAIMYPILTTIAGNAGREIVMGSLVVYFSYNAIVFSIAFIFANHAGRAFHNRIFSLDETLVKALTNYLFAAASITLIAFFIMVYLREPITAFAGYPLAYTLSLTVCFVLLVFLMLSFETSLRREMDLRYKDESLNNLREYVSNLDETRKFMHDHENLMLGFFEHINNNDISKIQEYYRKYMVSFHESTTSINKSIARIKDIKSPEIKSILSHKLSYAQHLGIKVTVDISEKLTPIDCYNLVDICRITGILLDNATEACEGVEGAILRVGVLNKGPLTLFVFENTCQNSPNLDKIEEAGYTTKGDARGIGLHTVSQILPKNPNLALTTRTEDGLFVQILSVLPS